MLDARFWMLGAGWGATIGAIFGDFTAKRDNQTAGSSVSGLFAGVYGWSLRRVLYRGCQLRFGGKLV